MKSGAVLKSNTKNSELSSTMFTKDEDTPQTAVDGSFYSLKGEGHSFAKMKVHGEPVFPRIHPKLKVNQPGDNYELEADDIADKIMRMPDDNTHQSTILQPSAVYTQPKPVNIIQRDDDKPETPNPASPSPNFTLPTPSLLQPSPRPDYLAMRQPFLNRSVLHLWDQDAAVQVWQYNFNFFRRFGLSPDISTSLSNFTAPRAIDSQLRADNPTWWEITDRQLNTSSIVGSVPVLDFDADFSPNAPAWLKSLLKKGGGNKVQRKVAHSGEETQLIRKETNSDATVTDKSAENYINSIDGKGKDLSKNERSFFEPRFGYDFSNVKVHVNDAARQSAKSINALAYTYGNNIVFGENQYQPDTKSGKTLIAHELTHVVQQQNNLAPAKNVMRAGSIGGFFSNLFHFGDYSRETYDKYLKSLNETGRIQNDFNSDDLARQIVEQWKADKNSYDLSPRIRVLLVREIIQGHVSGRDQAAVMDLLDNSDNSDLAQMFKVSDNSLSYAEIYSKFGSLRPKLELFNKRVLSTLGELKAVDQKDAKSIEKRLTDAEKQQGVEFKDMSVSFRLAGGKYYKSFLVDIVAPDYGVDITATLSRTSFQVRIQPGLVADVIWPIPNAELNGFTLTFAGLKPHLDIDGINLVSGLARNKVMEYFKELLAGTRFEKQSYDPTKDPNLISELADNKIIGDINRVKYNFERNFADDKKDKEDSKVPQNISGFSLDLNIEHKTGIPAPASDYGIMIPPGTKFNLHVMTSGTAAELMKKNSHLEQVKLSVTGNASDELKKNADRGNTKIDTNGIFLYKGKLKIASITSVQVDRGLKFTLGGVKTYVDVKELAKQESPKWAKGAVETATGLMKGYDNAVDTFHDVVTLGGLLGNEPRSDIARDEAVSIAEKYLGWHVRGMLLNNWKQIQSALGVSDKQISQFFGTGSEE